VGAAVERPITSLPIDDVHPREVRGELTRISHNQAEDLGGVI
jgi:hypothetical protein